MPAASKEVHTSPLAGSTVQVTPGGPTTPFWVHIAGLSPILHRRFGSTHGIVTRRQSAPGQAATSSHFGAAVEMGRAVGSAAAVLVGTLSVDDGRTAR